MSAVIDAAKTGVRCVAAGEDMNGAGFWPAARGHELSFTRSEGDVPNDCSMKRSWRRSTAHTRR